MSIVHYSHTDRIAVALDCIIFGFEQGELQLLLIRRGLEPEQGNWSLMGDFLKKDESLDAAAQRILHQFTGLRNVYLEQLQTFGEVDRDPVERTISVAYSSLINIQQHSEELIEKFDARWFPAREIPELIFDHNRMVQAARDQLRFRASHRPIGFELLPDKFTMPELQRLYEAIYDTTLDKRNFQRRILSMDILERLDEKQRGTSKKGAFYYRFNQEKYQETVREGLRLVFKPKAF
ncbi:MAG: NUDIX domain-containing protein [Tunicatimonas sp.]